MKKTKTAKETQNIKDLPSSEQDKNSEVSQISNIQLSYNVEVTLMKKTQRQIWMAETMKQLCDTENNLHFLKHS